MVDRCTRERSYHVISSASWQTRLSSSISSLFLARAAMGSSTPHKRSQLHDRRAVQHLLFRFKALLRPRVGATARHGSTSRCAGRVQDPGAVFRQSMARFDYCQLCSESWTSLSPRQTCWVYASRPSHYHTRLVTFSSVQHKLRPSVNGSSNRN